MNSSCVFSRVWAALMNTRESMVSLQVSCSILIFFSQLIAPLLPFHSPVTEDSMSINACQSHGETVAGKGRCKRTTNLQHSRCAHPAVVLVSRLPSTIPSKHSPLHLPFFIPYVVLRQAAKCKQDVGAVVKCIQVLYTSLLTSGCNVHPAWNICFR